jgi:hypothetical protein
MPPEFELPHAVIDPSALRAAGENTPTDKGYIKIYSTATAFAALKADGSIKVWDDPDSGGANAPTDKGYIKIEPSTLRAAKALLVE